MKWLTLDVSSHMSKELRMNINTERNGTKRNINNRYEWEPKFPSSYQGCFVCLWIPVWFAILYSSFFSAINSSWKRNGIILIKCSPLSSFSLLFFPKHLFFHSAESHADNEASFHTHNDVDGWQIHMELQHPSNWQICVCTSYSSHAYLNYFKRKYQQSCIRVFHLSRFNGYKNNNLHSAVDVDGDVHWHSYVHHLIVAVCAISSNQTSKFISFWLNGVQTKQFMFINFPCRFMCERIWVDVDK